MKQIIETYNGDLRLEDVPAPILKSGNILIQNQFSLISAGTERDTINVSNKGIIGKAKERPEEFRKVINNIKKNGLISTYKMVKGRLDSPMPMGYSCAGLVNGVASDVHEFNMNDRVACAGTSASHSEFVLVPVNLCARIPDSVSLDNAAFTTIGAIAMHGVRQSGVLVGETVAVIGLGLVGLLAVQILKAAGCNVIGIDIDASKFGIASELGANFLANPIGDDIEGIARDITKGYGVDSVIITAASSSNEPIILAGKITRDKGKVVVVGRVSMDIPRKDYYEKELDLRLSRSYGPGRYDKTYEEKGIDYPIGYVRWTEKRNMEAFLDLIASGKVNVDRLITHRFKIDDAEKAYDVILGNTEEKPIGILLEYKKEIEAKEYYELSLHNIVLPAQNTKANVNPAECVKLGFIGAGNFARSFLLPNLKDEKSVILQAVATNSGINANHVGKKFGFKYCSTDYKDLLNDPEINAVIIATRHNLHARIAIEAMKSHKAVYVEKPLSCNEDELSQVIAAYKENEGRIMVGFNRRFSPFVAELKNFLQKRRQPAVINYRINAGSIKKEHWVQDPIEGSGRIIGEVCHFVDLIQFIIGSDPINVYADSISANSETILDKDNIAVTIKFVDGSLGTISYLANGDKSLPKERLEIFCEESVAIIDDFRKLTLIKEGKKKVVKKFHQDKGYKNELQMFIHAVKNGTEIPVPFKDSIMTTMVTFMIEQSLGEGIPIKFSKADL